jgi:hypothetical protein
MAGYFCPSSRKYAVRSMRDTPSCSEFISLLFIRVKVALPLAMDGRTMVKRLPISVGRTLVLSLGIRKNHSFRVDLILFLLLQHEYVVNGTVAKERCHLECR